MRLFHYHWIMMFFAVAMVAGCQQPMAEKTQSGAVPAIEMTRVPENFHPVEPRLGIYRSGQPSAADFAALERAGFRSVLNLREFHRDRSRLQGTQLQEFRLPIRTGEFSVSELRQALTLVKQAPKPLLIHCWHGSDRTGTVVAAVRIVYCHWPMEQAIAEMEEPQYGFHETVYGNLPELLRSIDWEALRQEFGPLPAIEQTQREL